MTEPLSRDELADLIDEGYADKGAWPIPELIAAARLADDLAAVVKAAENWADTTAPVFVRGHHAGIALMDAVTALRRARQQEET